MPRWYLSLDEFKTDQGITSTDDNATLGRTIERASRWLEGVTRRVFLPIYAARKFDVPSGGGRLWFHDDLDTLSSVADGSGSISSSYYVLFPDNTSPKAAMDLVGGTSWTWGTTRRQAITVTGWWGYPTTLVTVGTLASDLGASATSFTLAGCEVGYMLRVGDELMHVSAVSGNVNTVERAQNGTTAAAHLSGATVSRYRVDPAAASIVAMVTAAMFASRENPGIASKSLGSASFSYGAGGAGGAPQEAHNRALLLRRLI